MNVVERFIVTDSYVNELHIPLPVTPPERGHFSSGGVPDRLAMPIAVYRFVGRIPSGDFLYEFYGVIVK